jgi:D-3-phosphoglycerate dehydrogenase
MRLANTPGAYSAVALAEHALMLMLALQKNLPTASDNCYHGVFYSPVAGELEGRSLGLIGFGASGRETAVRAHAFGMVVRAVDHITPTPEVFDRFGLTSMHNLDGLDEVLRTSDIVSLHLPLSASTQHLLDERRLGLMKKNAFVINVARGGLIDEAALIRHLQSGHLAGAGLDVFTEEPLASTNPLLRLKNVILTPHIAGITYGTSRRRNRVCVENALRVLQDKDILYEITRDP